MLRSSASVPDAQSWTPTFVGVTNEEEAVLPIVIPAKAGIQLDGLLSPSCAGEDPRICRARRDGRVKHGHDENRRSSTFVGVTNKEMMADEVSPVSRGSVLDAGPEPLLANVEQRGKDDQVDH